MSWLKHKSHHIRRVSGEEKNEKEIQFFKMTHNYSVLGSFNASYFVYLQQQQK